MKRLLILLGAALLANPAFGQAHEQLESVVRRGDRRGVILLFKSELETPGQPQAVNDFMLVDLTDSRRLLLKEHSVSTPDGCAYPEGWDAPLDRLCLVLQDAEPALDDKHHYALLTRPIKLQGKEVPALTVAIPPVAGAVQAISNETSNVVVTFSRDLSGEQGIEPRITVNGGEVRIVAPSEEPGLPLCYNRGAFAFYCTVDRHIVNGEVVAADIVSKDGRQPAGIGPIIPSTAQIAAAVKKEDVRSFYLNLAFSRLNEVSNGSLTFTTKRLLLRRLSHIEDPVYAVLLLHADVLATSKTDGSGRLSAGPQLQLSLFEPFSLVDMAVTPRWETDDKFTVQNTLLDIEARLYIPRIYNGPVWGGGTRQLFPRIGYEVGHTIRGAGDTLRWEENGPSRFTYGATATVFWPETARSFFRGGVQLTGEFDLLQIQRNERSTASADQAHFWTVGATLKVTPQLGFTLTRRSGRLPPVFKFQNALEIGASFLN
ncbi:hypothetical protein [Longimicrobium terrae]|uniref:Bacterial surface antigen (D15) domain-containing protein n=1 Tax=Longimicrobium terrae TaxID=1639882 RepID=A0A841H1M3_9BACT|nr:hypothetical protein [Longimicrobium terrae]MBB4637496.1 hypothetical protein [Longimicrobium terrae]MBB6071893.1 hypothetical protein [Longimicrobium terrae]NNC30443.1 hypothetical protein [Longimicrobium terrae]